MASIVAYQKASDAWTTYSLIGVEGAVELCTIDGVTYVSIPDDGDLHDQPEEIAGSVAVIEPSDELIDAICDASPHVALIRDRVVEMIAQRYSLTDEIKLLRTAPSPAFDAYNDYVEICRAWGRSQKAALGLLRYGAPS
ncbi:hypothetical protein [uncultured Caulobacter sp.]|uniref:hypothetical protein n=1 Tax=uncultured Caulobacter sp. TaxID=158749 RepID=UPI002627D923|nr:hypothetical protein [uncultured Caulobacter sp.]